MTHVQGFDSFEDAMQAMRDAEERANALTLPQQREIGYGDFWCRPVPEWGIFIFGRVSTLDELRKGEDAETIVALEERFTRGYRFGKAYSTIEPEGEWGDTHVANMWPITEAEFEEAKGHGWTPTEAFVKKVFSEAQAAKRAARMESSMDDPGESRVVEEDGS